MLVQRLAIPMLRENDITSAQFYFGQIMIIRRSHELFDLLKIVGSKVR